MKNILLILILIFGLHRANAQYVNIPDSNFRAVLKIKYPACFNGADMMDTTCTGIQNALNLYVANKNITSLQGVQYFKKLFALYCDSNQLTTIPRLNDTLSSLSCSHNILTSLPILPRNLHDLNCSYNLLSELPPIVQINNSLDCSNNPMLTCLPTLNSFIWQGIKVKNTAITCFPNSFGNDADTILPYCTSPCTFDPYIMIPDSNFRAALKQLYPNCFNGDRLDTTCSAILNVTSLDVSRKDIVLLEGIQYFKKLKTFYCVGNQITRITSILPNTVSTFYCSNNLITQIDKLPDSLSYFDCSGNQLGNLPVLPSVLDKAYVYDNKLTSLPALPGRLTYLFCWNNLLTTLPVLPSTLYSLHCYNNQLTGLPGLPSSLNSLICDNNQITALPGLPSSLNVLKCSKNRLTSIPTLPTNILQMFTCSDNQITTLPSLPGTLTTVQCSNNQITTLPTLPSSLNALYCSNNQISSLPTLPSSLATLDCSGNKISAISSFPSNLGTLYCQNNRINILPTAISSKLDVIDCSNNRLTTLPFISDSITYLNCSNNQLTSLPSTLSFYRRIGFPVAITKSQLICSGNSISCLPIFTNLDTLRIKNTDIRCFSFSVPAATFVDTSYALCTSGCSISNGYVNIPDSNFRAFLLQNYSSCMNVAQQLDTNCSTILNVTALYLNNRNIQSLQGIQYFKRLSVLRCDSNQLNALTILPATLITLSCNHNQLSTLPILPPTLKNLDCSNNILVSLPTILQINSSLNCTNNLLLSCLPQLASNFTQGVKLKNTGITCVPNDYTGVSDTILPVCNRPCLYDSTNFVTIPDANFRTFLKNKFPGCFNRIDKMDKTCTSVISEDSLRCVGANITSIDGIQYFTNLTYLSCDNNRIGTIATLPANIAFLTCANNQLTSLPVLPVHLLYLKCDNNKLTTLSSIPSTVFYLDCHNNRLSTVEAVFRDSLSFLYCNNNPLYCLPLLPVNLNLFVKGTNITCLPNAVRSVDTSLTICSNSANICTIHPYVMGKVYNDRNNNNQWDSTEQTISDQIVKTSPSGWISVSDAYGFYRAKLDTAINNSWSAINNYRYATITPDAYTLSDIHTVAWQEGMYDFGVHFIPDINDLEAKIAAYRAKPGFISSLTLSVNNVGTTSQSGITVKLKKPAYFNILSSMPTPTSIVGDTLIWTNVTVGMLAHRAINIILQIPTNAVIGTEFDYEAWVSSIQRDSTPLDNYIKWIDTIRSSFDPNDKIVNKATLPSIYYADKDKLLYTIRFQNTGTDTASTVIVQDVIPANLEVTSLRVVNASHLYQLTVKEKNIIEVVFPNIQLPDSNVNEALSHGFVQLEFKPKTGLSPNTEINNNAGIYFDYNEPVVTNTATTRIQITTGIADNKKLAFKLFPNPASSTITVELPYEGKGRWYLTDISGKTVQQNIISANTANFDIDVNDIANGTYLLSLEINGIISSSKVVIVR